MEQSRREKEARQLQQQEAKRRRHEELQRQKHEEQLRKIQEREQKRQQTALIKEQVRLSTFFISFFCPIFLFSFSLGQTI